jgi:hypothetical protein
VLLLNLKDLVLHCCLLDLLRHLEEHLLQLLGQLKLLINIRGDKLVLVDQLLQLRLLLHLGLLLDWLLLLTTLWKGLGLNLINLKFS